ncbi:MAG: glycoside hydrolase family 95 protein [Bacteroidales bacterium]|nr:glycoside hydrolase family 95 protein [Bacteroidales bacterium]
MKRLFLLAAFFMACACAGPQEPLRIWFDIPTSSAGAAVWAGGLDPEWESKSLPLGNGSLGAGVMGSISRERLVLNEKSLWTGGPAISDDPSYYWDCNKDGASALPGIWDAFLAGDYEFAEELTKKNFRALPEVGPDGDKLGRFGFMTTLGELLLDTGLEEGPLPEGFGKEASRKVNYSGVNKIVKTERPSRNEGPGATVQDYSRSLSLDSAMVRVQFRQGGVSYKREYFVSYPDQVLAVRFSSPDKGKQNLSLSYLANPVADGSTVSVGDDAILYSGRLKDNGEAFALRVKALAKRGKVSSENGMLKVSDASEVLFLVTSSTEYKMNFDPDFSDRNTYYKGENPEDVTARRLDSAASLGWKKLLGRHLADYQSLFGRVSLSMGGEDASLSAGLATPYRLDRYREGIPDPGLEALYFQYGRYLLIASSREGDMPANLQGIWCNKITGPWNTDYHNNINIQMNYWPANITNLDECMPPLVDFIRSVEKSGREVARSYYGARGWTVETSSNLYGYASPKDSDSMIWNLAPADGPWLATHLWDRYAFTLDREYLADIYGILAESADFCCDFLWKRPDGVYTAAPSTSPEHGPVDAGATFVHAVVRELLMDAIEASRVLGCDEARRAEWGEVLEHLPPYQIGRYGQIMEWSRDIDRPDDTHRHVNHLFGLHPGRTMLAPELQEAAKVVLEHRGDAGTGWSMGWKLNMWARLKDGDHAYVLLHNLLASGTLDNLWDDHPPFQIDGNFGGTAGMAEMLLQSHGDCIELLPALPASWPEGSVKGLCARGGFELSLEWENGRLLKAEVLSKTGGRCALAYDGQTKEFDTVKGKKYTLKW